MAAFSAVGAVTTLFLEYAPALLGFVFAAAAAVVWCVWLDRHHVA